MAKRAPVRGRPRKAKPGTRGLTPAECRLEQPEEAAAEPADAVDNAGGCLVGLYKEPLGGHQTLLSILPIDKLSLRRFNAMSPTLTTNGSPTLSVRLGVFSIPSSLSWRLAVVSGFPTAAIVLRPCAGLVLSPSLL
jgi:hypothetical protein